MRAERPSILHDHLPPHQPTSMLAEAESETAKHKAKPQGITSIIRFAAVIGDFERAIAILPPLDNG
jgi:hypothetical protein